MIKIAGGILLAIFSHFWFWYALQCINQTRYDSATPGRDRRNGWLMMLVGIAVWLVLAMQMLG